MSKLPVVIDTDIGSDVDDLLALALAAASPELEIIAVSTVCGDTRKRAAIARVFLDLVGLEQVPVFCGASEPVTPEKEFIWFGVEGDSFLASVAASCAARATTYVEHLPGIDALAGLLIKRAPEVVAIGPLTNLARLQQGNPLAFNAISRLTIAGGNFGPVAFGDQRLPFGFDYNFCADPIAALKVLRGNVPVRLVTLDSSMPVSLSLDTVSALSTEGLVQRALAAAISEWAPILQAIFRGFGLPLLPATAAFLHDPLTVASLYNSTICPFERTFVSPICDQGLLRTFRHVGSMTDTTAMLVSGTVDPAEFLEHFLCRVLSL